MMLKGNAHSEINWKISVKKEKKILSEVIIVWRDRNILLVTCLVKDRKVLACIATHSSRTCPRLDQSRTITKNLHPATADNINKSH